MENTKLKTPITWLYFIVFIIYNYELFILFFSDLVIEDRIKVIDTHIDNMNIGNYLYPLLFSIILLVAPNFLLLLKECVLYIFNGLFTKESSDK